MALCCFLPTVNYTLHGKHSSSDTGRPHGQTERPVSRLLPLPAMSTSLWPALLAAVLGGGGRAALEDEQQLGGSMHPVQHLLALSLLGEHALYWWMGILCFVGLGGFEALHLGICCMMVEGSGCKVYGRDAAHGWMAVDCPQLLEEYASALQAAAGLHYNQSHQVTFDRASCSHPFRDIHTIHHMQLSGD